MRKRAGADLGLRHERQRVYRAASSEADVGEERTLRKIDLQQHVQTRADAAGAQSHPAASAVTVKLRHLSAAANSVFCSKQ